MAFEELALKDIIVATQADLRDNGYAPVGAD